ncbi:MAG: integrase arm-type DNA-binding domain-containing protein [Rhodospirillaceae bacterium]|nr:integrase arm-type DNA-binding domain-containing protein [Rhodospirillaceae bacterium]
MKLREPPSKRTAKVKLRLTKRSVESLEPSARPWIAWDDQITGFGVRVQPSGTKSFLINYRANGGGRYSPNRRLVIGRFGRMTAAQARNGAQALLGRVAAGEDPAAKRAEARDLPTLGEAFEDYMKVNPNRSPNTTKVYRQNLRVNLSDWVNRPLNAITRRDVESRFLRITEKHGWAGANQTMSMLRSVYRRPCVDHDGLKNPVELWLAAGGKFHRHRRRKISSPAEVLPRWCAGIESVRMPEPIRDVMWIGVYTGMRLGEVKSLRWERVDLERRILRVEETKTGEALELPITEQLAAVFERCRARAGGSGEPESGWLFPSPKSASGHLEEVFKFYTPIGKVAGTKFWYHGLRNSFITVAERELLLPRSLTKRLVNHARGSDVTEGYAADWTVEQLREPAQRVADRIDVLQGLRERFE